MKAISDKYNEFISEYGNDYIFRHKTDSGKRDVIVRAIRSTATPERTLGDAEAYFESGMNTDLSIRFYLDPITLDFMPQEGDIVFDVERDVNGITVPIKILNAYKVINVGREELDNRLLFLVLVCNKEELGSWNK